MAQQGGQQSQGGNESLDFLWIIVVIVVAAFALWYFYKQEIINFILFVLFWESYWRHISKVDLQCPLRYLQCFCNILVHFYRVIQ